MAIKVGRFVATRAGGATAREKGGRGTRIMSKAAKYSAIELLRNGRAIEIRALGLDDRAGLLAAVGRSSPQSLYRRFFSPKRNFTEDEVTYFMTVDFVSHVALVVVVEEGGRPAIVGGARYIVVRRASAEMAFAVVDQYQAQGIGALLLRHLAAIARDAGIEELTAEVLSDNVSMLRVFEKSGFHLGTKREAEVVHVTLRLF
jgi:RimJ/RimL family protein N-acetyltransferase